jgi:hypothetical protein
LAIHQNSDAFWMIFFPKFHQSGLVFHNL